MADLYPPALRTRHSDDSPYPNILYPHLMAHSASSNSSEDDPHTEPHSPPPSSKLDHHAPKPDAKPQATFLTKLYAYLFFFLLFIPPPSSPFFLQPPRTPREPSHDSLGLGRRTHHRRAPRATRSPCSPQHLSSIKIRELLPATQCPSSFIPFPLPSFMSFFSVHRSMASCAKLTCAMSIPL